MGLFDFVPIVIPGPLKGVFTITLGSKMKLDAFKAHLNRAFNQIYYRLLIDLALALVLIAICFGLAQLIEMAVSTQAVGEKIKFFKDVILVLASINLVAILTNSVFRQILLFRTDYQQFKLSAATKPLVDAASPEKKIA